MRSRLVKVRRPSILAKLRAQEAYLAKELDSDPEIRADWLSEASQTLIEGQADRVAARPEPSHPFTAGQRVFHQKFGYGAVRRVDGDRLEIDFEKAGNKTVIHSFVQVA